MIGRTLIALCLCTYSLSIIIRTQIVTSKLTGLIPSVRTLAQEYGVAQVTAVRAVELLKADGPVVTVRGKGTYVVSRVFRHLSEQ